MLGFVSTVHVVKSLFLTLGGLSERRGRAIVEKLKLEWMYTLFFYKNVVFPAQAEYSYFYADFRLKIFLYYSWIIAYDIPVLEHTYVHEHVPFNCH